ncbi:MULTISPECIES: DUF6677 family protein [Rhodopirellula]|uniref:Putative membrane protein n=1 Tax=Rhodopirellula europaea SH398 TaxID=1263868 RepID=M5S9Z1_9BACT|nr:DUF6677 family protein [Rhodopirellula europaea]EMI28291.1 putative membrane protein [Rhodopirellula europaea SH398]
MTIGLRQRITVPPVGIDATGYRRRTEFRKMIRSTLAPLFGHLPAFRIFACSTLMAQRSRKSRDAETTPGENSTDSDAKQDSAKGSKPKSESIKINPKVFNGDSQIEVDGIQVDLRNRYLAAFLAWLIPGAGHFYQGRHTKGTLFVISILSIWMLGFALGGFHVVYASWYPGDKRWHYVLQAGVGSAALPALVQGNRMRLATDHRGRTRSDYEPLWNGFMAPPHRPVVESEADEVAAWYARRGSGYEMGTWYTMIAGLLNFLVVYDAFGGPLAVPISGRKKRESESSETANNEGDASPKFANGV